MRGDAQIAKKETGIQQHIGLMLLFLLGKFIALTFLCIFREETLVSQKDTQNSAVGDECLLIYSMKGASKPDKLHICTLRLISIPEAAQPIWIL